MARRFLLFRIYCSCIRTCAGLCANIFSRFFFRGDLIDPENSLFRRGEHWRINGFPNTSMDKARYDSGKWFSLSVPARVPNFVGFNTSFVLRGDCFVSFYSLQYLFSLINCACLKLALNKDFINIDFVKNK